MTTPPRPILLRVTACAAVLLAGACGAPSDDAAGGSPADTAAAASDSAFDASFAGVVSPGTMRRADLLMEGVCDTITNSFRCARRVEALVLPRAREATRRGDTLLLATGPGDTVRLSDTGGETPPLERWSYHDHWRDKGWFVLHKQYYEGSEYMLISDSTGQRISVPDRPLLPPVGRHFAVLSLDLVAGYGPNTIQIWAFPEDAGTSAGPELQYEREPERWGGTDGRWEDATTLRFTQRGYCDALGQAAGKTAHDMCERPARLIRRGGSWELEPGEAVDGG